MVSTKYLEMQYSDTDLRPTPVCPLVGDQHARICTCKDILPPDDSACTRDVITWWPLAYIRGQAPPGNGFIFLLGALVGRALEVYWIDC